MATPNPLKGVLADSGPAASKREFLITGLAVDVYGLDELPMRISEVTCLWLLHPRGSQKELMEPIARTAITEWNNYLRSGQSTDPKGLIAVAFDQRNHGSRLLQAQANEAWRGGNPTHAQDMFSIVHGTAQDTSVLINYLAAYCFPTGDFKVISHTVMGVSLGGHAGWQCILHDERVKTAIIVIGCADYVRMMTDRAAKSKLPSWMSTDPPGSKFLGSKDFPATLIEAIDRIDPAGLLMGEMDLVTEDDHLHEPSEAEKKRLIPLMRDHLQGKRILSLSGGADKLVPYKCSEPFLKWLKKAIGPGGWFSGRGVVLEDKIFEGVGHEMSPDMLKEAVKFLIASNLASIPGEAKL